VAFATRPGAVAFDQAGNARNSPFTAALLAAMNIPGQSISDLMITVRNAVDQATAGAQVPWDQSSLRAQVFLVPAPQGAPAAALTADPEPGLEFVQDLTVIAPWPIPVVTATGGVITPVPGTDQIRLAALGQATRSLAAVGPAANLRIRGVDAAVRVPGFTLGTPGQPPAPATEKALHAAIQTELQRIGCYWQGIDGDWGRGSQAALERFEAARTTPPEQRTAEAAAPTEAAWRVLLAAPEKTCKPQPAAQTTRKKPAAAAATTSKKPATSGYDKAAPAPAAEKKAVKCRFLIVAVVCS